MKKIVIGFLTSIALSTTILASSNIQIGASSNNLDSKTTQNGFFIGVDGVKNIKNGVLIGIDFTVNTFKVTQAQVSGGAYTMTTDLLIGYTFKDSFNIPLVVKAGIGYGVTRDNIINYNSWSPQYNASATYTVYKGFGIGVRYNKTNTTLLGSNVNIKSSIAYLNIKFDEYD